MIQTVINRSLSKGFSSTVLYLAVQETVHKCVDESQSVYAVITIIIYASAFTVPAEKVINREVNKGFFVKAKMEELSSKLREKIDEKKIKIKNGYRQKELNQFDSQAYQRTYPNTRNQFVGVQ